jgi:hypothetical protein
VGQGELPKSVTHVRSQLLNPTQENVVEWCNHLVQSATPLHLKTLHAHVLETSGQQPGKNWHHHYIKHHKRLLLAKLNGLDHECAKNFNRMTVADYFAKQQEIQDKYSEIPPEHNWNMDEKGMQMGGGHRGNMCKFVFMQDCKYCYQVHSDNLELVTVIKAITVRGEVGPVLDIISDCRT